jgi:hypothetical protein
MSDAFFEVLGPDRFLATELTRGPWDPGLQHAGPEAGRVEPFFPTGLEVGYHTAMEFRFVAGSFLQRHPEQFVGKPPQPPCLPEQSGSTSPSTHRSRLSNSPPDLSHRG